ncbi:hypothetical protein X801_00294, partial [Opisthorchis viverrini]
PNVALQKTVVGIGNWQQFAVDGNLKTAFVPDAAQFPYYYVDLGAVYELTSINLFCPNEGTFKNLKVHVPFDVHTFEGLMSPCNYETLYPWDPLASNLKFKKAGGEIVLKPQKPVRYIIIGNPNANYSKPMKPIPIGEVQAYGKKLRETPVPQVPEDSGPVPKNYYQETRRAIIGTQDQLWVHPGYGYFKPNHRYRDVVLGWTDQPKIMAIIRKKAKVFLIMGHALPIEIDWLPMYKGFRTSCKDWLTDRSSTANYVNITANYKPGDVILITRNDQFDVDKIYDKLISGENSAFVGYPNEDKNDSLSQLLEKLEIDFVRTEDDLKPQFLTVSGSADSNAFIPTSYWIERYVNSWKAFSTERFQVKDEELGMEQKDVEVQLNALVAKYGALMEYLAPCDIQNYVRDEKSVTALVNYNLALKYQSGKSGFSLPGVHRYPGKIPSSTRPTTVVAKVFSDLSGSFFPLGVYAKPGEAFRWTVLTNTNSNLTNQWIRINAQTDLIDHHPRWSRWPILSTAICMRKQGQYVSPHGGPLFLQLPQGISITILLENVYRYPWLDLRNQESFASFAKEIKEYSTVPWLVISGDAMNSMLRTVDVYTTKTSEVTSSARYFDDAVKVMHNYRGSQWQEARSEMFVADIQISSPPGHSGYPWMGSLDWSKHFTMWSDSIKLGGQPSFLDVMGKNLQVEEATLKGGDEVTNRVYRLLVEDVILGLNPYEGDMDTNRWNLSEYNGPGLGYYRYLGKLFGYGLVGNAFIEARKKAPKNEMERTQLWIKQMCIHSGYNLVAFHKMWNFPMTDEAQSVCKRLPCFFPDDEYTKNFRSKVDAVLNESGGSCSRREPKKAEFRGEIKAGLDRTRPQNIFLTFQ